MRGTVHETGGGVYRVRLDDDTWVDAALRGRLKLERRTGDKLVIGDRVQVAQADGSWIVEGVEPRDSEMVRRGPGGRKAKVVAANVDRVLVVVAATEPEPTPALVDRFLAVVESSGIHPVLVINKVELPGGTARVAELERIYTPIGYRVIPVSALTGQGMEDFAREVCLGTAALVGPSGVGKSTLLNALDPTLDLSTGGLSARTLRGRHTTVSSRLIPLECGGRVADTPGFGDVGLWGIAPEDIEFCFPEFAPYAEGCHFRGCAHTHEPDCGVRDAIGRGDIARSRYDSYVRLREEAQEAEDSAY